MLVTEIATEIAIAIDIAIAIEIEIAIYFFPNYKFTAQVPPLGGLGGVKHCHGN